MTRNPRGSEEENYSSHGYGGLHDIGESTPKSDNGGFVRSGRTPKHFCAEEIKHQNAICKLQFYSFVWVMKPRLTVTIWTQDNKVIVMDFAPAYHPLH